MAPVFTRARSCAGCRPGGAAGPAGSAERGAAGAADEAEAEAEAAEEEGERAAVGLAVAHVAAMALVPWSARALLCIYGRFCGCNPAATAFIQLSSPRQSRGALGLTVDG